MIELIKGFPLQVVAVNCSGHVTRHDYEEVLIPAVEARLKAQEKVRIFYRIGPEFSGIDPGAVLEDMKVGFSHLSRWERIAVVTDVQWIRLAIKAFAFLIPGALRFFHVADEATARTWIAEA
jgi:SpoIIAA-like